MSRVETTRSPDATPSVIARSWQTGRWLRVRGFLPLSLPPMVAACSLACYGAVTVIQGDPAANLGVLWALTVMATALSACAIVLGWYSSRRDIAYMRQQLEQLTTTGKAEMVVLEGDSDLVNLAAAINIHIAQLRRREARLALQKKELDIQTRITEAEKRCIETVIEKVGEPVIVTDAFDDVVLANRAAQAVFGFMLGAADRQPIHRAIRNPAMVQLIKSMRNTDDPPQRIMKINLNSETAHRQSFRASLTRVVDQRGHVHGVVAVLRPINGPSSAQPARTTMPPQQAPDQRSV